jgi:prepilin-type N-terminal cleavage/methylation domain-containing protein
MKKTLHQAGVTLIELLLVLSLVVIVLGASAAFLPRFLVQTNHDTAIDNVIGSARKAQSYAMDEREGATWGVCVTAGQIRMYNGSCSSPSYSEDFAIPSNITITGLSDITFSRRGEPSTAVTVSISSTVDTNTIDLYSSGGMELQ